MKPNQNLPASTKPIRVAVADDHQVVRQGLMANFRGEDDIRVVGEAADGVEALDLLRRLAPDVLILDSNMPRKDGLAVVAELPALAVATRVIMMTSFDTEENVVRAVKAGVAGYLPKSSSREEILEAVRSVSQGGAYMPARIVHKVAEGLTKAEITPRELDVLRGLADGKTNKEIGVHLFISETTVKSHVRNLLEKLNSAGRTAAVRQAVQRGLVSLSET
jgi:DNA-binding NarL/FixJ family response regulator